MKKLEKISLVPTTQHFSFDPFRPDIRFHVFVKNRHSDTSTPEGNTDFVSNLLAWNAIQASPPSDFNPYLGAALGLELTGSPAGWQIDIPLRSQPILPNEVILPVVNIHLYTDSGAVWEFNYTITFQFADGTLSYSPADEGVTSILLNSTSRNYSGICREANTVLAPAKPATKPVYLSSVTVDFGTHDDDKAAGTRVNVHIANRLSATSSQDIVIAENILSSQALPTPTVRGPFTHLKDFPGDTTFVFDQEFLASSQIQLQDIVLPVIYITIAPLADDSWTFDYRITFEFSNGMKFSSTTNNISLNKSCFKHAGVYNGPPLPTYAPPAPPTTNLTDALVSREKTISLSYVGEKLKELINDRVPSLFAIRFDSIRDFGNQRETYYDLQTITPDPPPPGTLSVMGYEEGVTYRSSPKSLGFLPHAASFNTAVNTESIAISIDPSSVLPVTVKVTFKTPFDVSYNAGINRTMTCKEFYIQIKFTLTLDPDNHKIDVLRWVHDINTLQWGVAGTGSYKGQFLGQPIQGVVFPGTEGLLMDLLVEQALIVRFTTEDATDLGGTFQKQMRQRVFETLSTPSPITEKSPADQINDYVNAWFLGGVVRGESRSTVTDVHIDGDILHVAYVGPTYEPPQPAGWPSGFNFSPGALTNIDHIVVLTKENRSFDSMLGYLSLPVDAGGQSRSDVDGLKGGEFNLLNGTKCPSFAFEPEDTIFSPNPPQDPQRTVREIDNGRMDGFVEAFADQSGIQVAPRIMGYHNAANVPMFDALSRDFAICHRWFAPHPGPTFPNRFYELTGRLNRTSDGVEYTDNTMQIPELDFASSVMPAFTRTIFDYLPANVSWCYFENGGYCFLRLFADHTFDGTNIKTFDDPNDGFFALAQRGELPNVSFIDPHFIDIPPGANCDEPPSDVKDGQELVRRIVEAIVSSPQWEKTLLVITYDEHGGFFDHVPPPKAAKVNPESADTYGVRVPTFVISPWVVPGSVFGHDGIVQQPGPKKPANDNEIADLARTRAAVPLSTQVSLDSTAAQLEDAPRENFGLPGSLQPLYFDHTSILKTIACRFMSSTPPYLGPRYAEAHDLSSILTATPRSDQFRPFIPYTLVYGKTNRGLEIPNGSITPGTSLGQDTPDPKNPWQQFRFEDAGNGYWYLRTYSGNLYLTADPTMKVTQLPKPLDGTANRDAQRWKLTPGIMAGSGFTISNAAFPTKTLQAPSGLGSIILGDPDTGPVVAGHVVDPWQVTSPSLPTSLVSLHAATST